MRSRSLATQSLASLEVRAPVDQPLGVIFGQGEDALAGLLAASLLALETLQALLALVRAMGFS